MTTAQPIPAGLLARKSAGPHSAHWIAKDALGLSSKGANLIDGSIDEGKAKASAIITSINQDREDDIVVPQGMDVSNYAANPVVLWDHAMCEATNAQGIPEGKIGLGMSENADGLCVYVHEDHIAADCYFHQKTNLSTQVCELVMKRLIRATSIGFKPRVALPIPGTKKGHKFLEAEMLEWSWAPVGVNADAITRAMSFGRIAGEPIADPLAKSLSPFVLPKKFFTSGWSGGASSARISKTVTAAREIAALVRIKSLLRQAQKITATYKTKNLAREFAWRQRTRTG